MISSPSQTLCDGELIIDFGFVCYKFSAQGLSPCNSHLTFFFLSFLCLPLLSDWLLNSLYGLKRLHFEAGSMLPIFHLLLHTMSHQLQVHTHCTGIKPHIGWTVASQAAGVASFLVNFKAELALEPFQLQCQAVLAVAAELRAMWWRKTTEFLVHLNPLTSLFSQQAHSFSQQVLCLVATRRSVRVVYSGRPQKTPPYYHQPCCGRVLNPHLLEHEAAEASEVLQNMDDLGLDPIIMAMRYRMAMMIGSRSRSSIFWSTSLASAASCCESTLPLSNWTSPSGLRRFNGTTALASSCELKDGVVLPFCSEETVCIASSSTKWMCMHDRISLLNVGPWFSWSAEFGYIFEMP